MLIVRYFLFLNVLVLAGCASQLAMRDCENIGYVKGSPEFIACAERQIAARRENILEMHRIEASRGLFGRTPTCKTTASKSDGSSVFSQECK